jgi:hypothetical protein
MQLESGARGERKMDEREMRSEMRDGRVAAEDATFLTQTSSFISPIAVVTA